MPKPGGGELAVHGRFRLRPGGSLHAASAGRIHRPHPRGPCPRDGGEPGELLHELWRVLTPGGRIIVVAPNRRGLWARMDTTPFGHGQPFSRSQLKSLMRQTQFSPEGWAETLYVPPLRSRTFLRTAIAWAGGDRLQSALRRSSHRRGDEAALPGRHGPLGPPGEPPGARLRAGAGLRVAGAPLFTLLRIARILQFSATGETPKVSNGSRVHIAGRTPGRVLGHHGDG